MPQLDFNQSDDGDFALEEWEQLPLTVIDSHGMPMNVLVETIRFNTPSHDTAVDLAAYAISNKWLLYAIKRYLIFQVSRVSPLEAYNALRLNLLWMKRAPSWPKLATSNTVNSHKSLLARVMSEVVANLQKEGVLYNFSRLRSWYCWCADYLPEFGFDPDEAYKWQLLRIPGNEKGLAVRNEDANEGPLHDAELILLRRALQADKSTEPEHRRQRAAVWLALAFGRNASNYAQLRNRDLINLTTGTGIDTWVLMIPRIKKRGRPRAEFKQEYVGPELAAILLELVGEDTARWTGTVEDRPLLLRATPRLKLVGTAMDEWAFHLTSNDFTALIKDAVTRYGIVSPRTGEYLELTTRRLRYTYATNRVREGISRIDLADALDHSDLQHVRVYFDARSTIVERLDETAAKEIAPVLALFKGKPTSSTEARPDKIIRIEPEIAASRGKLAELGSLGECGEDEVCTWFPPYSCYICPKFRPFDDSVTIHTFVLEHLVNRRAALLSDSLNNNRIALQLDEVIYACAHVIVTLETPSAEQEVGEHAG